MMRPTPKLVTRVYLVLMLFNTLATSFIWGINTLFLLEAGLSNAEAFAANAFFTVGQVLFEIPTGVIADTLGRRMSYLLGAITLALSTFVYLIAWYQLSPFIVWAIASILLGLGYTFFSGAVEAWLVDALKHSGYKGDLDSVFAKGQMVSGIAMLSGSVAGGIIAQISSLSVPYILRVAALLINFLIALFFMRDWGFTPVKTKKPLREMKQILNKSITHGLKNPPVRWVMLIGPFMMGVGFFGFYAMQPYLLELYGNPEAYSIAGLAAAIVGGAQIFGGMLVKLIRKIFERRTSFFIANILLGGGVLISIGLADNFFVAVLLLVVWAILFASVMPIQQSYLNGLIPSKQRATVLSFSSLIGSSGGVVVQPLLGKAADVYSFSASYIIGGGIQLLALPFALLAKRERAKSDPIGSNSTAGSS